MINTLYKVSLQHRAKTLENRLPNLAFWLMQLGFIFSRVMYRVAIQVETNLLLTSKQRLNFSTV